MSVCQYYLRGQCRYGDRCRMLHSSNKNDSSVRSRHPPPPPPPARQPINPIYNYVASGSVTKNYISENSTGSRRDDLQNSEFFNWILQNFQNKQKALDIIEQLKIEAKVWLKCTHLWRFTSKSLFPGGRPLPDWADYSFEELKWAHQSMTAQNCEHVYKKQYFEYITKVDHQLVGLTKSRIDTLQSLKDHINEYIASNHQPTKTLSTDIEMQDINSDFISQIQTINFTSNNQLSQNAYDATDNDTFEFGQIPIHAPSKQFC